MSSHRRRTKRPRDVDVQYPAPFALHNQSGMARFFALPDPIRARICAFDDELVTKLWLIKRHLIERRTRALLQRVQQLQQFEAYAQEELCAQCPHRHVHYECNGDYHKPGFDKYCKLCRTML